MEYTVNELAKISGVSARTLRFYDEKRLLRPAGIRDNGYRFYTDGEVDRLQQILFYRELGVSLEEIAKILSSPSYDREEALQSHLITLENEKARLDTLIKNVSNTLLQLKGEYTMKNKEKFEGFKKSLIDENEKKYGEEARKNYGSDTVDATNAKLMGMTEEQWSKTEATQNELFDVIRKALTDGDPDGSLAKKAFELHREWLCAFWKTGMYSPEAHACLAEGYVADERFKEYYDKVIPGAAVFLRDSIKANCR